LTALNANSTVPSKGGFLPQRFKVLIQGFGRHSYEVRFIRKRLVYRAGFSDAPVKICPTEEQWIRFWSTAEKCNLWSWKSHYDNLDVLDGTQWELDIRIGTQALKSSGSNYYPGGNGTSYSKTFRLFLGAVQELIDGRRFG
jgi:hypothetical protein